MPCTGGSVPVNSVPIDGEVVVAVAMHVSKPTPPSIRPWIVGARTPREGSKSMRERMQSNRTNRMFGRSGHLRPSLSQREPHSPARTVPSSAMRRSVMPECCWPSCARRVGVVDPPEGDQRVEHDLERLLG